MPTLVITKPDGSKQEQELLSSLTIGRADGNDLVLAEGGVSRKHARFFVEGASVMVEDAGSANGTWVDGEKIEGPTKLAPTTQVVIGDYEISLKPTRSATKSTVQRARAGTGTNTAAQGDKPAGTRPQRSTRVVQAVKQTEGRQISKRPAPQRSAGPQLKGLNGAITGKAFSLSGTMIIGRVEPATLLIDDDSVSRRHAQVQVEGRQVVLTDLGSANGTTVNGAPISEETILNPGDIIQVGVVELMFETGAPSRLARPQGAEPASPRRPRPASLAPVDLDAPTAESSTAPSASGRGRVWVIGGVVSVVLFVALIIKGFTATPEPIQNDLIPLAGSTRPIATAPSEDPADEIEASLVECRTYSNSDTVQPDWVRAEAACNKVLELEPIQAEANQLIKKITVQKQCELNLNAAKEEAAGGRLEEALVSFQKIGKDCGPYLLRALSAARDVVAEVKKRAGVDCKAYATAAKWDLAYKRCELYAQLACQTMEPKDLYPPALMKMKLDGPLKPGVDWRPSDPLYINFLKAREKLKPGEPLWSCPEITVFRPPPPPPDPSRFAKDEILRRYSAPELGKSVTLYFDGKFIEAQVPLQKITENMAMASLHESARALLIELNNAISLYKEGSTEIQNDRLEKAEEPFLKALAVDERLVLGPEAAKLSPEDKRRELERRTSFVRRNVVETMSSTAYRKGVEVADRKDFRAACRLWKLGIRFSRSNFDLLKAATNQCTARASDAFDKATTCEQLKAALDFAVDGDTFKEKIVAEMSKQECTN